MALYETVAILKPALSDAEAAEWMEKTRAALAKAGGEVVGHEVWGRRKLVHPIGKARDGVYLYLKYNAAPSLIKKLSHDFSLDAAILRQVTMLAMERVLQEKPSKKKKKAAASVPAPAPSAS